ncbi:MAG: hypothetical protein J6S28_09635, partial [Clostridia bacterium]|nr:hypothetical protein [Clostridia bacterium]
PKSPPQRRNLLGVFGSFCARGVKKNGNDFLTFHPNNRSFFTLSSFSPFFLAKLPQKEPKTANISRLRARLGALPQDPASL